MSAEQTLTSCLSVQVVEANKNERRKAAGEAELLLQEEQLSFEAWRDSLETVPTIKVSISTCAGGSFRLGPSPADWTGCSLPKQSAAEPELA